MIVGYRLSFQVATALTTALTLRQAIWRKDDPRWSACGMPNVFYTDHGSDFTCKHIEQVAADIGMELVFSEKGVPRRRGKVERFFRSVDQLFLQDMPGYASKGYGEAEATLTLPDFEQRFRKWLLEDYHHQLHNETEWQGDCFPLAAMNVWRERNPCRSRHGSSLNRIKARCLSRPRAGRAGAER